jgi:hypothetical protein
MTLFSTSMGLKMPAIPEVASFVRQINIQLPQLHQHDYRSDDRERRHSLQPETVLRLPQLTIKRAPEIMAVTFVVT